MKIAWFSAGVSSAVATKLSNPDRIFYNPVADMHPDTYRFIHDCEVWFNKPVEIMRGRVDNVEDACRLASCLVIPRSFTACTKHLKIAVRKVWEKNNPGRHTYIWGMDLKEAERAEKLVARNPDHDHEFPLITAKINKKEAHGYLAKAGIKRPAMYYEGYPNNNCLGCIRGKLGYWNKIRIEYPAIFASRAKMERVIGYSIMPGVYLDELSPERGRKLKPIVAECGAACEVL